MSKTCWVKCNHYFYIFCLIHTLDGQLIHKWTDDQIEGQTDRQSVRLHTHIAIASKLNFIVLVFGIIVSSPLQLNGLTLTWLYKFMVCSRDTFVHAPLHETQLTWKVVTLLRHTQILKRHKVEGVLLNGCNKKYTYVFTNYHGGWHFEFIWLFQPIPMYCIIVALRRATECFTMHEVIIAMESRAVPLVITFRT